jgi:putative hydrolase of the HAD superfamily
MRYTHLLFDFFGTLVDYSPSRTEQGFEAAHAILSQAGATLSYGDFLATWDAHFEGFDRRASVDHSEYSMDEVCASFFAQHLRFSAKPELIGRFRDAYLAEWSKGVRYIPGVADLLDELAQRHGLALVTNTHHAEMVRGHLRRMQIEPYFPVLITSVEHGRRKPSKCIFARALQLCGASAANALYIGDSYAADYQGAISAGLDCLLIDPKRQYDVPDAHRLEAILELRRFLSL